MGEMVQTKLEDFSEIRESKSWQEIDEHNRYAMKNEYYKHLTFMERLFAKIVEDLEKKRC